MQDIAITPEVLRWAIDQSGISRSEVADKVGVSTVVLRDWEKGDDSPSLTQFRNLASVLRRQTAFFFLASTPTELAPNTSLRRAPGTPRTALSAIERRYLREIGRFQKLLQWILVETGAKRASVQRFDTSGDPEQSARLFREKLGISFTTQAKWKDPSEAFRAWRAALESMGMFVFLFPMGKESARGMSVWNDWAPAVAINTAWNVPARVFTLLHECAHLVSRTDSACVGYTITSNAGKDALVERWCERFAAAVLLPRDQVKAYLSAAHKWRGGRTLDLSHASRLSRQFKVSLRAAAIALIEVGAAERSIYAAVSHTADEKAGGGGGRPRTRSEVSEDKFGVRTRATLVRAMRDDLMTRADVLSYLDVGSDQPSSSTEGA